MENSVLTKVSPSERYVVEIGGKFASEYRTFTAALKAGMDLKNKDSKIQVRVHDATEQTRPAAARPGSVERSA
jgi:hypothetical protein